jgi:hypothetical protein
MNESLLVFPNPASGFLNFQWQEYKGQIYSLRLMNAYGQFVLQEENLRKENVQLNTGNIAPGIYLLQIMSGEKSESMRVVVR